jgi:hypothetical protein
MGVDRIASALIGATFVPGTGSQDITRIDRHVRSSPKADIGVAYLRALTVDHHALRASGPITEQRFLFRVKGGIARSPIGTAGIVAARGSLGWRNRTGTIGLMPAALGTARDGAARRIAALGGRSAGCLHLTWAAATLREDGTAAQRQ